MKQIYFDYAATTPVDKRVINIMQDYLGIEGEFGNPASNTHNYGLVANEVIEKSRAQIATLIGAESREVIFTSGATESDNLAIKGIAYAYAHKGRHIITTRIEHKAVLDTCAFLETEGFNVTYLDVDKHGQIDLQRLKNAIGAETILISIMAVNNELGTIYPLAEIGQLAREHKLYFHVDAAQGVGKIDIDVKAMNIDLLSLSGHKIYAPKGIGALYVRRKPKIRLAPLIHGGGHELGYRSGTLATHQIAALGKACEIMAEEGQNEREKLERWRDLLIDHLINIPAVMINTPVANSYAGIINVTFKGVDGESLIGMLHEFALSTGSACNSQAIEPSFVLSAIGVTREDAHSTLRISMGRFTAEADILKLAECIDKSVSLLRSLSPFWQGEGHVS
ncbi:MAG: cysteine desulfurase family protein [Francisellaceae bacterium]